jgi:hypothetical protein
MVRRLKTERDENTEISKTAERSRTGLTKIERLSKRDKEKVKTKSPLKGRMRQELITNKNEGES